MSKETFRSNEKGFEVEREFLNDIDGGYHESVVVFQNEWGEWNKEINLILKGCGNSQIALEFDYYMKETTEHSLKKIQRLKEFVNKVESTLLEALIEHDTEESK